MEKFVKFCTENKYDGLETVVEEYRAARNDDDKRKLQQFMDAWADVLQEYTIWLKHHHSPATMKTYLAILQSFFRKARVPIEVDLPKRIYTEYPKRDLKRETIQLIISRSTVRNRAIWLMQAESGLRSHTITQIRW